MADLEVLAIWKDNSHLLQRYELVLGCKYDTTVKYPQRLTSLDTWEEMLNAPEDFGHENVGIVRSNSNRLARTAAACVSVQLGYKTILLPGKIYYWHYCYRWD